jgi:tripartite-type tricarboxylate transporter receptor subunit TctC
MIYVPYKGQGPALADVLAGHVSVIVAEAGVPGYEVVQWFGVLAPAHTPRDIVAKLHAAIVRTLQDPTVKQRFVSDGGETVGNTPEQFAAVIRNDLKKWEKVIKSAGIKPE